MQKNGMGRFSLYVDGKVLPVCGEVSGCFQTYVEHFNEGLKIDAWGYMKGDSLYVNRYRAVAQQTSAR
jgi:hypothetical protein